MHRVRYPQCQGLTPHERGSDDSSDSHFSILNSEKSIMQKWLAKIASESDLRSAEDRALKTEVSS